MLPKRRALLLGAITSAAVIALAVLSFAPGRTQLFRGRSQSSNSDPAASQQPDADAPAQRQIKLLNNEIYLADGSGQWRQLTHDGKKKERAELSPGKDRVAYHATFDPYKPEPEPVVLNVLDVETGSTLQQIPVHWPARFVAELKWVQEHLILLRGEGAYLAVVNLDSRKQTHQLVGSNFSLSPGNALIIYRHDFNPRYGSVQPEYDTDHVLLSLLGREPPSGLTKINYKVVYPDPYAWGEFERKPYRNPNDRHRIKSDFAWSPDGRMVAFVETTRQRCWLIVLKLDATGEDVLVSHKRFELGPAAVKDAAASWMPEGRLIKVSSDVAAWLVDVETGQVQSVR